jgi:hypothetical protein
MYVSETIRRASRLSSAKSFSASLMVSKFSTRWEFEASDMNMFTVEWEIVVLASIHDIHDPCGTFAFAARSAWPHAIPWWRAVSNAFSDFSNSH